MKFSLEALEIILKLLKGEKPIDGQAIRKYREYLLKEVGFP